MFCNRYWNSALFVAAALSIGVSNANAQGIYSTGFESPTYSLGTLSGQNGWSGPSVPANANVEDTLFHSGTQAVEFVPDSLGGQFLFATSLSYNSTATPGKIVDIRDYAYIAPGPSPNWDILSVFGNSGFIGQLLVINLDATLGLASSSVGSVPVSLNSWNEYDMILDYATDTQSAYVNGTEIGSGVFASASTSLSSLEIGQNSGAGSANLFVDDISVTAGTPEPGSIALIVAAGITGICAGLRRERTRVRRTRPRPGNRQ